MRQGTKGFTLLEISIVLVVLAVLAGGVLVGQTLIKSAEIRALVKQPSEMDAAINVFEQKYNCLPGDCKEADELGFENTDLENTGVAMHRHGGDGDGRIAIQGKSNDNLVDTWESMNVAYQLGKAGLIKVGREERLWPHDVIFVKGNAVSTRGYPGVWSPLYMFYDESTVQPAFEHDGHYYISVEEERGAFDSASPVLSPADSYAFDQKLDDGLPRSGLVLAVGARLGGRKIPATVTMRDNNDLYYLPAFLGADGQDLGPAGAKSDFCITNDTIQQYNIANESRREYSLCALIVSANF
jgi:prepilin-type N-terminal cleavage/methylation domain-containing protein